MSRPIQPAQPAREVWRRDRREKIYDAICWTVLGIVGFFAVTRTVIQGLGVLVATPWLFIHSPLPWWIRIPAATAVAAGFVYLFQKGRRKRIPPNQKFVD